MTIADATGEPLRFQIVPPARPVSLREALEWTQRLDGQLRRLDGSYRQLILMPGWPIDDKSCDSEVLYDGDRDPEMTQEQFEIAVAERRRLGRVLTLVDMQRLFGDQDVDP